VIVAALLSNRGASHRLLRQVGDDSMAGGALSGSDIDRVLQFLCANANLRPIFFLWRPFLVDPKDHFVLELAVESRADFVLTFNTRDFAGAERFGIRVISPREFLAIIGEAP
jgi:predicted nucleic acid-binding protein